MPDAPLDCMVIGGGSAGLTAAICLARFNLHVLVVDRGSGRAQSIPLTCNQAGYPDGVVGADQVASMDRPARDLGAEAAELGCIKVVPHQRTSVSGLYAAGDVVLRLDQISNAMREAGVASTAIRNDLNAQSPLLR